jgi:inosine-uridine nucleoside N-ribohydrolase
MLDVDTGVDDAAAIALAVTAGANLVGISTVAGNVGIGLATENTRAVLARLNRSDVPVFRGASRPLVAPYRDARHVHGANGLGGATLPASPVSEQAMSGPEAIIRMAEHHAGELVLVAVGPLTNVAMALSLRPDIVHQVAHLVVMGGAAFVPGNTPPGEEIQHAEFNVYLDPHAAAQVFDAGWSRITMIGLDVTHQVAITRSMWEAMPEDVDGTAGLIRAISEQTFREDTRSGFFLHDPLALAVGMDPSFVDGERCSVDVSLEGDTRGKTTVSRGGNVLVATTVDRVRFQRAFSEATGVPYVDASAELERAV